ncbi:MAG: hypothetical protein M3Y41_16065 [Pseudomonadota bacterium]|nr:hypothetical protein [Pseudomonadota bacterium]
MKRTVWIAAALGAQMLLSGCGTWESHPLPYYGSTPAYFWPYGSGPPLGGGGGSGR